MTIASDELPLGGSGQMFDAIADRYDLLNRIISLGVDQKWRSKTVHALRLGERAEVLDLATGTADLAIRIADSAPDAAVVGLDPSSQMLEVGRRKVSARDMDARIQLVEGDAQSLPFETDRFDGATIAFGIRNVPDRDRAIAEAARVLKPGARFAVLELSEPTNGLMGPLARFHIHRVVPWIGGVLSGRREYRYLQRSIAEFPSPSSFAAQMEAGGFDMESVTPLTFGVCVLYVGVKR